MAANASYPANSFNMNPRKLGHPKQGRFEPADPRLGGYIYVADTLAGAVAEGVLRNQTISKQGVVRRPWLVNKKLVRLRLGSDVTLASVYGSGATKLNLDTALLCGGVSRYSQTRETGTKILLKTKPAFGMRCRCRNHDKLTSLMLITRVGPAPVLTLIDEVDIFFDEKGRDLVLGILHAEFELQYSGKLPN
ncbi:RES domain-containing protein [Mycobacterium sp. UM_Kg1]|uniref:RES domain-containing protein n=1 Tax=Mycobacterium sp. UM_Kg1 TaxID=1545691 RepID=UPI00178CFF1E|nr:RES domain-containing protein [Mycobacterium sp. UM_Kg1]